MLASRFRPELSDRAAWLARIITELKPDIIHSLEFQHAGYLTLAAKNYVRAENWPKWAVSNWGSDIFLFGRLSKHTEKIRSILANCDYYLCECHRDLRLARAFGFNGEALAVLPNSGGFEISAMLHLRGPEPTSARRVIALKGYQNWAGRALVGLRALEMCADMLKGYTVKIYLATQDVQLAAELFAANTGIPVEIKCEGNTMTHDEVLRLHASARISIGLSISDAISTSMLEAMVMGSFPIQSDTSCADEWLQDGKSGIIVPAEDPCPVAQAIRRALTDDELVDSAAEINARLTSERLDKMVIQPQVLEMYKRM